MVILACSLRSCTVSVKVINLSTPHDALVTSYCSGFPFLAHMYYINCCTWFQRCTLLQY